MTAIVTIGIDLAKNVFAVRGWTPQASPRWCAPVCRAPGGSNPSPRCRRASSAWQKAALALANKNARILWAVMTKGHAFDARHVSVTPG